MLTNRLQDSAATPLLLLTDAEWGVGMRLDSAFAFPRQMTLGAISDDSSLYLMSGQIARDCRRMGIHMNLAPVVDVNNNPSNPVIAFRSFGEDPEWVARKGSVYLKGHMEEGILVTAKHFPGHGDTDMDSHYDLPVIPHSRRRIDSVELLPFRRLIREGTDGIMIAHLYVPAFDTSRLPTTLSPAIITDLLKKELGFGGFVISDALDMQGVTKYFKPGEIELKALLAGNDILLLPQNLEAAVKAIRSAADSGLIADSLLEQKVRQILRLKYRCGLNQLKDIDTNGLYKDLNPVSSMVLERRIFSEAITMVKNSLELIPLQHLDRRKIAILQLGDTTPSVFAGRLKEYAHADCFSLPAEFGKTAADSMIRLLTPYDVVIIGLLSVTSNPAINYGLTSGIKALTDTLGTIHRTILADFGTPYALNVFGSDGLPETVVVAYQNNPAAQLKTAEMIFGGLPLAGKLPVTAGGFPAGTGLPTEKVRLSYILPEEAGIPSEAMQSIDSLIQSGINIKAYPGCQVLFAKRGRVFYSKAFGNPVYSDTTPVQVNDLYDLASLTKVMATTLAIMKLDDDGKLTPDDTLGRFLPWLRNSNKSGLTLREVMAHQAGLQPWIKFYKIPGITPDSIRKMIIHSPVSTDKKYKYSDLGFYLLKDLVEQITQKSFESYLDSIFYKPLGLQTICFNPLNRSDSSRIIPSTIDSGFRGGLVKGQVHDQGAFLLGGVSGHAGLFSDAADLAVILQMLLNCGTYGGKQYLSSDVVGEYTRTQFPDNQNRRGLGFDKPPLTNIPHGPVCNGASPSSYGHSGFTGTYAWADPEHDLIYIFLSNRTFPDAANNLLSEKNIRTEIHQRMYDILQKYHMK